MITPEPMKIRFPLSAKTREVLTSEASRLSALADFLRERGIPVLDFWAWDRQFNAQRCVSRHD